MGAKNIFISYSWKDKATVDPIDEAFRAIGIDLIRDERHLGYLGSIKEFMRRVREEDFVIMVISDAFLRSSNCMFEVMEMLDSERFQERLLPIHLDGADIFTAKGRLTYIKFWDHELKEANETYRELTDISRTNTIMEELNHFRNIRSNIDRFFEVVADMNIWPLEKLQAQQYLPIINLIGKKKATDESPGKNGLDLVESYQQVLRIQSLDDREEQEIALFRLLREYPEHKPALFLKAYLSGEDRQYLLARFLYEEVLKLDPRDEAAHLNLGVMLAGREENKLAEKHYKKVLEINPQNVRAHWYLADIYTKDLEYERARYRLEKAVELDPSNLDLHIALGELFKDCLHKYDQALGWLEKALILDPQNAGLLMLAGDTCRLAGSEEKALSYYRRTLELNPLHIGASQRIAELQGQLQTYAVNVPETAPAPVIEEPLLFVRSLKEFVVVRSPMVGEFYRGRVTVVGGGGYYHTDYGYYKDEIVPFFAQVGDFVRKADIIFTIAAMGLANEIETEHEGVVLQFFVEDEQPVEYDQPLLLIDPQATNEPLLLQHGLLEIRSPMVGSFYRGWPGDMPADPNYHGSHEDPSESKTPPFFQVGDDVRKGETLCVVMATRLYNEIESDYSGKLMSILAKDGQRIEYDQILFLLDPYGRGASGSFVLKAPVDGMFFRGGDVPGMAEVKKRIDLEANTWQVRLPPDLSSIGKPCAEIGLKVSGGEIIGFLLEASTGILRPVLATLNGQIEAFSVADGAFVRSGDPVLILKPAEF